jgi:hypothetical protein
MLAVILRAKVGKDMVESFDSLPITCFQLVFFPSLVTCEHT